MTFADGGQDLDPRVLTVYLQGNRRLEVYRWEPAERQPHLLEGEPPPTGDENWDALLAAVAEHLTDQLDWAPPAWSRPQVLATPWFPSSLPSKRMEALVYLEAA